MSCDTTVEVVVSLNVIFNPHSFSFNVAKLFIDDNDFMHLVFKFLSSIVSNLLRP